MSPTVTIDTASAPGSWDRAIRHARLDCRDYRPGDSQAEGARGEVERVAVHEAAYVATGVATS